MDFKKLSDIIGLSTPQSDETRLGIIKKSEKPLEIEEPELRTEIYSWDLEVENASLPKRFKSTILVLGTLLLIYLTLNQDFIFVILILSLVFLYNILSNSPKKNVRYKIYNTGIDYFGTFYKWDKLKFYFFFPEENLIGIDTHDVAPGRLYVYFSPVDRDKLDNILNTKLDKASVVPKNYVDMMVDKVKPYIDFTDK